MNLASAIRKIIFCLTMMALALAAFGQNQPPASQESGAVAAPASASLPKPAPEMEKLAGMLIGKWQTAEKFEPNAFLPKGGSGNGTEQYRRGPGGFSVIADYESTNAIGKFSGHEIITWDAGSHQYESVWLDSFSPTPFRQSGKWEMNNLVFAGTADFGGKSTYIKHVYSDIKEDSFTLTEESSSDGGPLTRVFTISYKRVKPVRKSGKS